ncbi:MAG: type I methionyl aminopeptidase [Candidatus Saccharimonadales bacterium]
MAYTKVKKPYEIVAMRDSGRMLATVLQLLKRQIAPNMSTKDLADIAATELKSLGGIPTCLGYYGFPDVLCVSVNDEVVHGIPRTDKIIQKGDLVSLDLGVTYQNMITDAAISVLVGGTSDAKTVRLIRDTEAALLAGIAETCGGCAVGNISAAVQQVLDKGHHGIVRDLVGHGVGHELHEDPNIPNYGRFGKGPTLQNGMTIAIEPMATMGTHEVYMEQDGWTIKTRDGSWAAHFEHTVLVTPDGAEIMTILPQS